MMKLNLINKWDIMGKWKTKRNKEKSPLENSNNTTI